MFTHILRTIDLLFLLVNFIKLAECDRLQSLSNISSNVRTSNNIPSEYSKILNNITALWTIQDSMESVKQSLCRPAALYAPYYDLLREEGVGNCKLKGEDNPSGVLVTIKVQRMILFSAALFNQQPIKSFICEEEDKTSFRSSTISDYIALKALNDGVADYRKTRDLEDVLLEMNIGVSNTSSPDYGHLDFFRTKKEVLDIGKEALICLSALHHLRSSYPEISGRSSGTFFNFPLFRGLSGFDLECKEEAKFLRTFDGSCNNPLFPDRGQSLTPFQRLGHPDYSDGLNSPRKSKSGNPLPSARLISSNVILDENIPSQNLTLSVMQWGQFIDHDLAHTPIFRLNKSVGIECCSSNSLSMINEHVQHSECFPIEVPHNDPFYRSHGRKCLNFVRSIPVNSGNCDFHYREQLNQVTHFLDASTVYGSSLEENRRLRSRKKGRLKVQRNNLLPIDPKARDQTCKGRDKIKGMGCFLAGDSRVNVQPDLSLIHTLWVRQHNRIAEILSSLNPRWKDERLFQISRKIVIAQIQHIVYNEWLPLIIGEQYALSASLVPERGRKYSNVYDESKDPRIFNEFSTVALRFGHSLVQGIIRRYGKSKKTGTILLHNHFNRGHTLYNSKTFDSLLKGLSKQRIQRSDSFISHHLTNRLFQTKQTKFGLDLVALNIQRGRDHGIPSYNDLRRICDLKTATFFHDFEEFLPRKISQTLQGLYESVDDVDPFIGGISEFPVIQGIVGPTFRCIIAEQFKRLKEGDRFYYENNHSGGFSIGQLNEIKKISWARIICDNGNDIKKIQPMAFRVPGSLNKIMSCSNPGIPNINYKNWKQNKNRRSKFP